MDNVPWKRQKLLAQSLMRLLKKAKMKFICFILMPYFIGGGGGQQKEILSKILAFLFETNSNFMPGVW